MEFGRLSDISQVDFTLPSFHIGVAKVLGGVRSNKLAIYVGGPVWSDEGFPGKIYPKNAKEKNYVKHYSEQFNTIELNATHYRIPPENTINRWYTLSASDFKFCPKIHQSISHANSSEQAISIMQDFYAAVIGLKEKLGISFLQMPPTFSASMLEQLLDFLDICPLRNLAIELRHTSWFTNAPEFNTLCNYLYKNNMTLVITDVAGRRDVSHQRFTSKKTMIRFVANDLHSSDYTRLTEWSDRIASLINLGLEEIYFFIHTPNKAFTPELVDYFIKQINRKVGVNLKTPTINRDFTIGTLF